MQLSQNVGRVPAGFDLNLQFENTQKWGFPYGIVTKSDTKSKVLIFPDVTKVVGKSQSPCFSDELLIFDIG